MPVYFQRPENALKRANGQCGLPPHPHPFAARSPRRGGQRVPLLSSPFPSAAPGCARPESPSADPAARGLGRRLPVAEEGPPGNGAAPPCREEMAEACRRRPRRMAEARPGRPPGAGPARLRLPLPGGAPGRGRRRWAGSGRRGGMAAAGAYFAEGSPARAPPRLSLRPCARGRAAAAAKGPSARRRLGVRCPARISHPLRDEFKAGLIPGTVFPCGLRI